MKNRIFAALLVVAVLVWWNQDSPMLRDQLDWTRAHLGISQGRAASTGSQYVTAPVEQGELRRTVTATGTLNAIVNVEVGSQLTGQIAELLVDFNDEVNKGQPLARLDQRTFEARAADAMAEVAISVGRAKLERARVDAVDSESQRAVLQARTDNARVKLTA